MSMRALESAITSEARRHFNNRTLRVKDLMEWSTGPIRPQAGEVVEKLPLNGVYVAIKVEHDKRPSIPDPFGVRGGPVGAATTADDEAAFLGLKPEDD